MVKWTGIICGILMGTSLLIGMLIDWKKYEKVNMSKLAGLILSIGTIILSLLLLSF